MNQASALRRTGLLQGLDGCCADLFDSAASYGVSELHVRSDPRARLRAIVAIHGTQSGRAVGGCRLQPYPDSASAIEDALRLAQGMSYKAALADLPVGGGKAVLLQPDGLFDRRALFEAFGDFVESLGGRYATAVDSGTTTADMDTVARRTRHVLGASPECGGSGDPSPFTAKGVRLGIQAAVRQVFGRGDLADVHVAIQGCGHVGHALARELQACGARLSVADTDPQRAAGCAEAFAARVVSPTAILQQDCDVFAPCALGAVVNDATVSQFKTRIIAGAANNQLASDAHGILLHRSGVLYIPDFMINAGGLIHILIGDPQLREAKLHAMIERLATLLAQASATNVAPFQRAIGMARAILRRSESDQGEQAPAGAA